MSIREKVLAIASCIVAGCTSTEQMLAKAPRLTSEDLDRFYNQAEFLISDALNYFDNRPSDLELLAQCVTLSNFYNWN